MPTDNTLVLFYTQIWWKI